MRVLRLAAVAAALVVPAASVASVVTYMDDETLVRLSPVIVHATVESVVSLELGENRALVTDVSLLVSEAIRGRVEDGGRLRVRLLGGRVEARESRVFGVPSFAPGEEVVLFARPTKAGWLTVTGLFQGKVVVERTGGEAFAERRDPPDGARVLVLSRPNAESPPEPLGTFLSRVRSLAAEAPPAEAVDPAWLAAADDSLAEDPTSPSPAFTLLLIPLRRFEPDSGAPVVYRYNPQNAPSIPDAGGPRRAFENALAAWNAVKGHALRLVDGGDTTAQCYLTFDGITGISHDDPCDEAPAFDEMTCSGVLAIGGLSEINPFEFKSVNGQLFLRGLQGDVVLNRGADCFWQRPGSYEEVLAHEIGHTFGLGHSCGDDRSPDCSASAEIDDAQMRAFAHGDGRGADPRRDDVKGIRFVYPPRAFVEPLANGSSYATGDRLDLTMDLNGTVTADLWLFAVAPGGQLSGGKLASSISLRYYVDVPILGYSFLGTEAPGSYTFVLALTVPGGSPAVASNLLSYGFTTIAFTP